jgi:DnaJ-class molecular chaperone
MRQNIALLLIAVVVLAGAAGVLAMTNFTKTNQSLNISPANTSNTAANNSVNKANTDKTSSSSSSGSDDSNSNNNNNGGSDTGGDETCPECSGAGVVPVDPSDPNTSWEACPTCGGDGVV